MTAGRYDSTPDPSRRELPLAGTGTNAPGVPWRKLGFIGDGVFFLALAIGFGFQVPWITALWRWLEGPVAHGYLAAILASFAAGSLVLARSGEWRAAIGGTAALIITCLGFAAHVAARAALGEGDGLLTHAAVLAVIAALAVSTLVASLKSDATDVRPVPLGLRCFFLVFALLVLVCGIALLLAIPAIMPWELAPQSALLIGWIFVGLSFEYAYVALKGSVPDARVLLVGFLVYGAAFALPLVRHLAAVEPMYLASLIGNLAVLALSAPLALFYLAIAETTRATVSR